MDENDRHELAKESKSSRSVFDFSSVEDLGETGDLDVPRDTTQPKIPFNKSYIAHAPSRHLFTLSSRCTYFGGFEASRKDIGGSVEDLTGQTKSEKRNLSLSKFSKSSPDLFGARYQSSNIDDVTEQVANEDFVMNMDFETKNNDREGIESITKTKQDDDTKLRLKTKWATKIEDGARHTGFSSKAKNDATASVFERLSKTEEKETMSLQHPRANNVSTGTEISVSKNNDEKESEGFDKGWKTILHSGKAELKKSLEHLNSFRQDMNSREIYNDNVDTFESECSSGDESIELQGSAGEEMILKHASEETMESKNYETGIKRNYEMAGLNMDDLLTNGKQQKIFGENLSVFSSSSSISNTADHDKQINYSDRISCQEEKYTTVNTDEATIMPRDKTANGNAENQTALSIVNLKNDNLDCRILKEVDDQCLSSDVEMFQTKHKNRSGVEAATMDGNYGSSFIQYNSIVEQVETSITRATDEHHQSVDNTVKGEVSSERIILESSCNISPIPLRVLSNSYHEGVACQNTEEIRRDSTNATVKVSEIRQSIVSAADHHKLIFDRDQSLLKPDGGNLETAGRTKDSLKLQTNNEERQTVSFKNNCSLSSSNSAYKPGNDWQHQDSTKSQIIDDEKQETSFKNDDSSSLSNSTLDTGAHDLPKESADNSLMKDMMGMFCLLGLKDSPEGGFYGNGQLQYEQGNAKDISSEENEEDYFVDGTITKSTKTSVDIPKDISKSLFVFNQNQGNFEEQESLNNIKVESLVRDYNESTDADEGTKSVDSVNNAGTINIQETEMYESPLEQGTFDEYISDVFTLDDKSIVDDEALLINIKPEKTLNVSDVEKGKQEEAVNRNTEVYNEEEYNGNTEGYIDEEDLSRTEIAQDLLLQLPDEDESKEKKEGIVHLNMGENYDLHFIETTADLSASEDGELKLSQENKQRQNLKPMISSNLQINRNKWSHALIIPHRTMNTKKLPGAFNILILDSELILASPEHKQTVVTLNFYAHEEENYPRGKNDEVSRVDIQMNGKKENFKVGDSNSDLLQEPENEDINRVEDNVLQSNPVDSIELVDVENNPDQMDDNTKHLQEELPFTHDHVLKATNYLENEDHEEALNNEIQQLISQTNECTTYKPHMEKVPEKYSPNFDGKEAHETITDTVVHTERGMQPTDNLVKLESDNPIQETVQKIDIKGMKGKRLSEHLKSFETDELVDEKITKQEKTEQYNLFAEFDRIFLLEHEIQEIITKEEIKDVQHEILLKMDELFTSEEGKEGHEIVTKPREENNNFILSQKEVSSSEHRQNVAEKPKHLNDLSKLQKEVPEVITKTVGENSSRHKYLFQLDEVLQPKYVNEIVPHKLKVKHDKHDNLLETDKYFDSLKHTQQRMNNISFEQSEFPEQITSPESSTRNVEESVTYKPSSPRQNNEDDILETDNDRNYSGLCEMEDNLQDDAWEITFNEQEVLPFREHVSVSIKDTRVPNIKSDELILMISNPINSTHDGDDYIDDERQFTASPISSDSSSVTSYYDTSAESSFESSRSDTQHQSNEEDCPTNHNVPWNVTVTCSSHDTMGSEYKILRASYSNIQPEVYKVDQYRTTMDIQQNQNQVSTSYVLFQRFGKQESPKTYFELNYDVDEWKVGQTITSHRNDDQDKTFVVSYATIEQVNHPQVASSVFLPTIEEDEVYEDAYAVEVEVERETTLTTPPSPLHPPLQSSSPSPTLPLPPSDILPQSLSPTFPPPQQSSQTPASPPLQLPRTTKSGTLDVQNQELLNLHTGYYSYEDLSPKNMPYPIETSYTQKIEGEVNNNTEGKFEAPEEGPVEKHYTLPQTPPPIPHGEDIGRLPTPLEISPEDLPYEPLRTIDLAPPVLESRPPVWSFAQSVFHTDGQSKTFFKVIDNRNKSFHSSTFMYRGERTKVSRKVNVFKNCAENGKQDNTDEQTIQCRVNEDYEGYSEVWDDGNLMSVDNEAMVKRNEPVTRSTMAYEMTTEQDYFTEQESGSCSWHLNLHGDNNGVCKISSDNLDAIAVEDDNTLIGSKGFSTGQHTWVIQGLGIFCAVGVCYPGAEVGSWYKGEKWVWTTDGLKYSKPTGIGRSEFGQWRNEDVLVIFLDCEEQTIRIVNTRTSVEATLCGFKGEVCPYFNIYKGSCVRLLQTSMT